MCNNRATTGGANTIAHQSVIDSSLPTRAKSALCRFLRWATGSYSDIYAEHSNGERPRANRLLCFGTGEHINIPDGPVYSGRCVKVAAGHTAGAWTNLRCQGRLGALNVVNVAFEPEITAPRNGWVSAFGLHHR